MATKKKSAKKPAKSNMDYANPKKKAAKKAVKKTVAVKKSARQQGLPGMEDRAVNSLEELALSYADIRDSRIALSVQEGDKKKELIKEMKRLKKEHYKRDGITVDLVHEKENIKVRVKARGEEDDEPSKESVTVDIADDPDEDLEDDQDEEFEDEDEELTVDA